MSDASAMPPEIDRIPDDAIVVRGGRNLPDDWRRGRQTHPSGVTGVSVECAVIDSIEELSKAIPHNRIGVATVLEIRAAGGDVVRTTGRSSNHATVVNLNAEDASRLFTPTVSNPVKPKE